MLFAGLGSVRVAKNRDRGLENAWPVATGHWPSSFKPDSQFFIIRTDPNPNRDRGLENSWPVATGQAFSIPTHSFSLYGPTLSRK